MKQQITFQFDGQRPDEIILRLFRRHYSGLIMSGLRNFSFIIVILVVSFKFLAEAFVLLGVLLSLGLILQWLRALVLWYYSFYIITNQRLRYTQRFGLFRQVVLDFDLDSIEMLRYQTSGFLAEMTNCGDLVIDSSSGELTITKIKNAKELYNLLQDLMKQSKKETNETI